MGPGSSGFDRKQARDQRERSQAADGDVFQVWRKQARGDDALAQSRLGLMYELGHGVPRNYAEAARWYRARRTCKTIAAVNITWACSTCVCRGVQTRISIWRRTGFASADHTLGLGRRCSFASLYSRSHRNPPRLRRSQRLVPVCGQTGSRRRAVRDGSLVSACGGARTEESVE